MLTSTLTYSGSLEVGMVNCRFVIEATVEENVQRLSSQRAGAMDLSAAAGAARGKQVGQQEPLTVRYQLCNSCL